MKTQEALYCQKRDGFVSTTECSECWSDWKFDNRRCTNFFNCRRRNLSPCGGSSNYSFDRKSCRECNINQAGACVGIRIIFGESDPKSDVFYEDVLNEAVSNMAKSIGVRKARHNGNQFKTKSRS